MNVALKHSETNYRATTRLGIFGENAAAEFLRLRGYTIVIKNFSAPIGRNRKGVAIKGEIDIIAFKNGVLCYVEVKTRSDAAPLPESAVTVRKQRQIVRTARAYRRFFDVVYSSERFDVIAINSGGAKAPLIKHLKGYFSSDKFQKTKWVGDRWFLA